VPFDPDQLRDPDPIHRPAPFWAINDRLDPAEVARQAHEMRKQGFGGGFFHSRSGLLTEYLSDEWFAAFEGSLRAGRENGFLTWMYDEDLWPSGFAGGLVLDRDPDFAERYLKVATAGTDLNDRSTPAAWFHLSFDDGGHLTSYERCAEGCSEDDCYVFYFELMAPTPRFGGQPYADLGNVEAMKVFIEMSYESYRKQFPDELGGLIPGCFTDEPAIHNPPDGCAWSKNLPQAISDRHGYDIHDHLPLLFFEGAGYEKVRYEHRRALNLLFVEAFTKQCYDWCEDAGIALTGHYLLEDSLQAQISTGGATMPHYEFQQLPGIDFLCLRLDHEITMHQVRSAARQFGRQKVLSELFGVSGAQCTFEDQKWMGDYHLVHGVNFFCQHLTLYSMRGACKRDYPPTISYQNPYWPHYGRLNDYFSRLGYALGEGRAVCDLLVLHPVGSGYVHFTPGQSAGPPQDGSKMQALDEDFMKLTQSLMRLHRDFDYGDEEIMERHGRVEGGRLRVGEMAYGCVVVPPGLTWRRRTLELLREFLDAGGRAIFVSPVPSMIEGRQSDEWGALLGHGNAVVRTNHAGVLERALSRAHQRDAQFSGGGSEHLLYQHRRVDDCDVYFIINTDRHATAGVSARLKGSEPVTLYDAFTDTRYALPAKQDGDFVVCDLRVPPVGSVFLWLGDEQQDLPVWRWPAEPVETIQLDNSWQRERLEPNALTLDMATIEAEGVDPSRRVLYKIRRDLQRAMGFQDLVGLQPWRVVYQGHKTDSGKTVKLRFEFESAIDGAGRQMSLVVEEGMGDRLTVNGAEVSLDTNAWHWDIHFGKLDIAAHVKAGTNVIEVTYDPYDFLNMVEELYLVGDFSVRMGAPDRPEIGEERDTICTGDWVDQGYPFYSGRMIYRQTAEIAKQAGKAYRLALHEPSGACHLIRVNGEEAGFLVSQPWQVDITDLLRDAANTIEIEVVGTMRNTFGPLHLKDYRRWIGPGEFEQDGNWEPPYHFHPYGLLAGAAIEITDR
jgi:hypothetical protein